MSSGLPGAQQSIESEVRGYLSRWTETGSEPTRRDLLHALSTTLCNRLAAGYARTAERYEPVQNGSIISLWSF